MAGSLVLPAAAAGLATLGLVAYELYRAESPALQKLLRSVGISRVSSPHNLGMLPILARSHQPTSAMHSGGLSQGWGALCRC